MNVIPKAVAAVALTAVAAHADTGNAMFDAADLEYGEVYRATTLMGETVHAVEEAFAMGDVLPVGTSAEWDRIGEIGDFLIGVDGTLQGVVVDVGGFLGVGEREVAIRWDSLNPVYEEDDADNWLLTIPATREMIEAAPELERDPA